MRGQRLHCRERNSKTRRREMEEDRKVQISNKWLENLSVGGSHQLEALCLAGLKIVQAHEGFIRCNFVVSDRISDEDGNWHTAAMATLIDDVGAAAICSLVGHVKASLDFSISYYSTVQIQEEVELEAKVVGEKGKLMSVVIELQRKRDSKMEENQKVQMSNKWLEGVSKGITGHQFEPLTLDGLKIVKAEEGFILCNFIISDRVSDRDGNWNAGAMASLIDNVGAAAIFSLTGFLKASLEFTISYYFTAKIQEEVEIEAKVVGEKGKLTSVVAEVRRKENGEVIALGKQWMANNNIPARASKL